MDVFLSSGKLFFLWHTLFLSYIGFVLLAQIGKLILIDEGLQKNPIFVNLEGKEKVAVGGEEGCRQREESKSMKNWKWDERMRERRVEELTDCPFHPFYT